MRNEIAKNCILERAEAVNEVQSVHWLVNKKDVKIMYTYSARSYLSDGIETNYHTKRQK